MSKSMRFNILISFVTISGFTQGMLLPLLAILLEDMGVSSSMNGLHATGLYIGVLIASPFMEKPLHRFGYKPMIVTGGALVFISLLLFPVFPSLLAWFILRLGVGIGDHMLNFATQTWITSSTPQYKRGKIIAIYGLFFSLGFALGPFMLKLVKVHQHLPFFLASFFCFVAWIFVLFIQNDHVEQDDAIQTIQVQSIFSRFGLTIKLAWLSLLGPFAYGILEAVLHGIFPVYGVRIGYSVDTIAYIIPLFSIATLFTQVPLGTLSDKIGRKKMLAMVTSTGTVIFFLGAVFEHHFFVIILTFIVAGGLLGSLFSMGVSFMTDSLPKQLLPAGNIMCGISFSLGSMIGPYFGGSVIQHFPQVSLFYSLAVMLLVISLLFILFTPKRVMENN